MIENICRGRGLRSQRRGAEGQLWLTGYLETRIEHRIRKARI